MLRTFVPPGISFQFRNQAVWSISVKFVFIDFFNDSGFVVFSRIMTMLLSGMNVCVLCFPFTWQFVAVRQFLGFIHLSIGGWP